MPQFKRHATQTHMDTMYVRRTVPGGNDWPIFSAFCWSVTFRVYRYLLRRSLNLVNSLSFLIFTSEVLPVSDRKRIGNTNKTHTWHPFVSTSSGSLGYRRFPSAAKKDKGTNELERIHCVATQQRHTPHHCDKCVVRPSPDDSLLYNTLFFSIATRIEGHADEVC